MKKLLFLSLLLLTACSTPAPMEPEIPEEKPITSHPDIEVFTPTANSNNSCPISITGQAKGFWFFEGSFPVELQDLDGNTIAKDFIMSSDDWMTTEFVDFEKEFYFSTEENEGVLIFHKSNASGLPELDDQIEVPINFTSCSEEVVIENYVRNNIALLSPVEPVLGGSWYVLELNFEENTQVFTATYEDGHIQESFQASYSISSEGIIEITLL